MAIATIEFDAVEGESLSVELYPFGALVGDAPTFTVVATEQTNDKGLYRADVTAPTEGWYNVRVILTGSSPTVGIARYQVYLKNLAGIYRCGDGVATVADKTGFDTDVETDDGGFTLTDPVDILTNAQNPKRIRTEEGTVEERTVEELIAADRYLRTGQNQAAAPWGIKFARMKPPDALGTNSNQLDNDQFNNPFNR